MELLEVSIIAVILDLVHVLIEICIKVKDMIFAELFMQRKMLYSIVPDSKQWEPIYI